jgi:hypothetical protein
METGIYQGGNCQIKKAYDIILIATTVGILLTIFLLDLPYT